MFMDGCVVVILVLRLCQRSRTSELHKMDETTTEGASKGGSNPQDCRADLRERFLWAVSSLIGRDTTITMHENIDVSGVFRGIDKDVLSCQIQNLVTPAIVYPWAMIRVPDCFSFRFKL
ncbi:gem-associated protein 7-like [Homarus americanus]|uniref:gem-associated protein 7-like n=1 Tax=Homarus americanus TaxID=6706 RepID=UPI001C457A4C|nr:gem-associated protein 7-like [Homarus americanus]